MKQVINQQPFIGEVIGPPARLSGRWAGVKGLPPLVVRTIADLAAGKLGLECLPFAFIHDSALVLRRGSELIVYRTRSTQVYTKSSVRQEPATLALFAAHLLLTNKGSFPPAYARLLAALAAGSPQSALDTAMLTAGKALLAGCQASLHLDGSDNNIVWFYEVREHDEAVPELSENGTKLAHLLASPTEYGLYLAGQSVAFAGVKVWPIA
jgi:hypothetical protein